MPLDEQSRRLTQFIIVAFMSKIFRPPILKKHAITYLDDVFMQSQTKDEMFIILEQNHQILKNENMKAAPDKHSFS